MKQTKHCNIDSYKIRVGGNSSDRELQHEETGASDRRRKVKRRQRTAEMVVLTPKVTVLTGMPGGPRPYVFLFPSNRQLSFLLPPASAAIQGPQTAG